MGQAGNAGLGRQAWLLAGLSGLAAGVALPPLGLPPLLWLALAGLWALAEHPRAPLLAGLWGAMAVLVSHRWLLALHPLDWIGVPAPLSLPLCLLLLLLCSGWGALLVALWLSLAGRLGPRRPLVALLMAALWGLAEVLLAKGPLFWLGIATAALPHDRPLAGLAALGGSGLLAALQLLIGWSLWRLRLGPRRQGWALLLLGLLLLGHGGGAVLLAATPLQGPLGSERVLVLQPAIPTRRKFAADQQDLLQRRLMAALQEARDRRADLVVLPEGALGLEPHLAQPAAVELISGGFRWQEQGADLEQRSSLLRFAPGQSRATSHLDKHRLVPLGEWVPGGRLWRWSGLSAVGGLAPGPASRLLPRPQGAIAGAICYELSDGQALREASRLGARWLLVSANLDPYPPMLQRQFLALAQLRAIETHRWLVSAANTGPSALISSRGRVMATLPAGRAATGLLQVERL